VATVNERDERMAVQGPRGPQGRQGNQGNRGEQGSAGLSRSVRRALVFLFALSVILAGANLFWPAHEVHASQAAQQHEQAAAQRAGAVVEQRLCTTLGRLAALTPPGGPPAQNPSRAYEQALHAALAQLGPDIGCK
jgi:hypothetical protein